MLSTASAVAQEVPNGKFADWGKRANEAIIELGGDKYDAPALPWDCSNIFKVGTVSQTEGRTPGSTAALLETKSVDLAILGLEDYVIKTAILTTDDLMMRVLDAEREQGVECTSIPRYLVFWYKYLPVGRDVAQVLIQFNESKLVNYETKSLVFRKQITERTAEWTMGYIDLSMDEEGELGKEDSWVKTQPVAAYAIDITSSISELSPFTEGEGATVIGSKLWITDLQFTDKVPTGIDNMVAVPQSTKLAPIYNLAGQRVDSNYKGVVVSKGKKAIQ